VGAKLFHAERERQTDMAKLIIAFHYFVKAFKIDSLLLGNQGSVVIVCVFICIYEGMKKVLLILNFGNLPHPNVCSYW